MSAPHAISAELVAVIVSVTRGQPRVLTLGDTARLPSGPFSGGDRSLQSGLRTWVERQTGLAIGYVEQLYTFADRDRLRPSAGDDGGLGQVISVSYLALAIERPGATNASWRDWYSFFPWEDRRPGRAGPGAAACAELPVTLAVWADSAPTDADRASRRERIAIAFGNLPVGVSNSAGSPREGPVLAAEGAGWNEELALARYELMFEAALVEEAGPAFRPDAAAQAGERMVQDHRRILATAIARLRAKVKYRALVFELMPPSFTLLALQQTMEALAGRPLHKQNFRRLIAQQNLVEETGAVAIEGRGRPAKLFRFRGAVLAERRVNSTRLPVVRGA